MLQAAEKYLSGEARVPFKSISRGKSLTLLSPSLHTTYKKQDDRSAACSYCSPRLSKLLPAFQAAGMHGIHLHNRQSANSTGQHRNYKQENEWLLQNVFDSHGNYVFYYSCILTWINVHEGCLSKLQKTKRDLNLSPLRTMTKCKLKRRGSYTPLSCRKIILSHCKPGGKHWKMDTVTVRYPYGRHGLKAKCQIDRTRMS